MIESIVTTLKKNSGTMMLCAFFGLLGLLAGVFVQADEDGVYIHLQYGDDSFTVGSNKPSVARIDIKNLNAAEAIILASKLYNLDPNHIFAKELIEMRMERLGPFKPVDIKGVVVVIDDQANLQDNQAMACRASPLYGARATLYDILSADQQATPYRYYQQDFNVVVAQENLSRCAHAGAQNRLWVSRGTAQRWFQLPGPLVPSAVIVTARISDHIIKVGV